MPGPVLGTAATQPNPTWPLPSGSSKSSERKNNPRITSSTNIYICNKYKIFIIFYSFIFRESGKEGERMGEKHQCVVASHAPPTGDLAHNPGTCPYWESHQQPLDLQPSTQSTEPRQPRLYIYLKPRLFLFTRNYLTISTLNNTKQFL